jgi:hypothetical protein
MKSEEKKSLTVRMTAIILEMIKSLAKETALSVSEFVQMKCLDLEVEEEVVFIKKKKTLVEKNNDFSEYYPPPTCNRCYREVDEISEEGLCSLCEEIIKNDEEPEE